MKRRRGAGGKESSRGAARSGGGPRPGGGGRGRGYLPVILFALLTVVLYRDFLFSSRMLFGTDTLALGYFARAYLAEVVRGLHTFPLWQPRLFGGLPFLDAMHGDVFYPTTLLSFILPVERALGYKIILHVFFAGCFMYLLMREWGCRRAGALVAGASYLLAPTFVSYTYAGHDGKMFVIALTPLAFLLLERTLSRRRLRDGALLAIPVALLILSAHVQLAYFALWSLGVYALVRLVREGRRAGWGGVARPVGLGLLGLVLGIAIASIQLWPPYLYVTQFSPRAGGGKGFAFSTSWSLHAEEILSMILPSFVGYDVGTEQTYWGKNVFKLNSEYLGVVTLLLALGGLGARGRDRRGYLAPLAGVALVYSLGASTPLFRLFYAVLPGVALFRAPSMVSFLVAFAAAALAGLGADRLLERPPDRRRGGVLPRPVWIAGGALVVLALALSLAGPSFLSAWVTVLHTEIAADRRALLFSRLSAIALDAWVTAALAGVALGALALVRRGSLGRAEGLALLVLALAVDEAREDRRFIQTTELARYYGRDRAADFLRSQPGPFRALAAGGTYPYNYLAVQGLEEPAGHHGNEMRRYVELLGGAGWPHLGETRLLDFLGVRYVLTRAPFQHPDFREAFVGGGVRVYENLRAFPRAFLAREARVAQTPEEALSLVQDPAVDLRRTVILEEDAEATLGPAAADGDTVLWVERGVNAERLHVRAGAPAILVVTENHYPAWDVVVDGRPARLLRGDYAFRAVAVPAGVHEVAFRYRSPAFRLALAVSLGALGLLVVLLAVTAWWGRGPVRRAA